jgi:hypothetical protein
MEFKSQPMLKFLGKVTISDYGEDAKELATRHLIAPTLGLSVTESRDE